MKKILRVVFAISLLIVTCGRSYGWNDAGHMFIASVAYSSLTPAARSRVDSLLRLNPKYESWVKRIPDGTPSEQRKKMLFMFASTWADAIRSETIQDDAGLPFDLSIGYADTRRHGYWHYIDLTFSTDGTEVRVPPEPNLKTIIPALRDALNANYSDSVKSYSLVWLIHLVGDAHQPVHCAQRASRTSPDGDYGGNSVIVCDPQCGRRLHSLWDSLVDSGNVSAPLKEQQTALLQRGNIELAADLNSDTWINESFRLARSKVYVSPIGQGAGPFQLTPAYLAMAKNLANQRAVLAGMRLARVLNAEFK